MHFILGIEPATHSNPRRSLHYEKYSNASKKNKNIHNEIRMYNLRGECSTEMRQALFFLVGPGALVT